MGYIVTYGEVEVTCESVADLNKLMEEMNTSKSAGKPKLPSKPIKGSLNQRDAVERILGGLKPDPLKIVIFLDEHGGASDKDLLGKLGETDNKKLGGFMSSITKVSRKFGLPSIVEKEMTDSTPGSRAYRYWLSPKYEGDIKDLLK